MKGYSVRHKLGILEDYSMTMVKIKIQDNCELRRELDCLYEGSLQIDTCEYALLLAIHIMMLAKYPDMTNENIVQGFIVNEQWQSGNARAYDVRQVGFKINSMAKNSEDVLTKTVLRVVGHAVASAHMKEHAMVASDYAIKVINLLNPDDEDSVTKERNWQIECLKKVISGKGE